jgi:hypothetical protein
LDVRHGEPCPHAYRLSLQHPIIRHRERTDYCDHNDLNNYLPDLRPRHHGSSASAGFAGNVDVIVVVSVQGRSHPQGDGLSFE